MTLIFHAVARMVPIIVLTLFGYVLLASSLRQAFSEALKSADGAPLSVQPGTRRLSDSHLAHVLNSARDGRLCHGRLASELIP